MTNEVNANLGLTMKYFVRENATGKVRFTANIGCGPSSGRATKLRQAVVWAIGNNQSLEHCDLSGADLAGFDFSGRVFYNCNFTDADLTDTSFRASDVRRCDFIRADLTNACFRNALATMANFTDAITTNMLFATHRNDVIGLV
jgi:uncharacterized protein YjbI with pentapeptide repeats